MKKSRNAENFPERLQLAMKNAGISQADLARKLGTAWSTVARWQAGSMPRFKTLLEIASALGVASRWLESGEGEMTLPAPEAILAGFPDKARPIVMQMLVPEMLEIARIQALGFFLAAEELAAATDEVAQMIDDQKLKNALLYLSKTVTKEAPHVRNWYSMFSALIVGIIRPEK